MLPDWAPSWHPLVIHFPIALLFAAVGIDLVALGVRRASWLRRTAATLYVLGAVAAVAAWRTGEAAARGLQLPATTKELLSAHQEWGERTLWVFGILGIVRLAAEWRGLTARVSVHLPLFLAGALGLVVVNETGEHGGQLVYQHGVGVVTGRRDGQPPPSPVQPPDTAAPSTSDSAGAAR